LQGFRSLRAGHGRWSFSGPGDPARRPRRLTRQLVAIAVSAAALIGLGLVPVSSSSSRADASTRAVAAGLPTAPVGLTKCPWLAAAIEDRATPTALAAMVVDHMTLKEKLGELVLRNSGPYENVNAGVGRLCIPSLTLQDGPAGLAFGDTGVTQLPAPLGMAASFDPSVARQYGEVMAEEAIGQGIDVVQAPNLNIDRVPESGQGFTGYGEDPRLVSVLGDATISGIQSRGVMADAKHLAVYSQETNRGILDTQVSERVLREVYLAPFESAIVQARVASVMCAYPRLTGTFQCQDPTLAHILRQWGFSGFVRSDQGAVHNPAAAEAAGTELLKPASVAALTSAVNHGQLPVATVDAAVQRVLAQMFAFGLIGRPLEGIPGTRVDTAAHTTVALRDAERSVVLLRNRDRTLPLQGAHLRSVAVIGAAASGTPVTAGSGSAHVIAPFISTPLAAITARLGDRVVVRYADGGSTTHPLPAVPHLDLTPLSGRGHGLTLTIGHAGGASSGHTMIDPSATVSVQTQPPARYKTTQIKDNPLAVRKPANPAAPAGGAPGFGPTHGSEITLPPHWGPASVTGTGTLTVPQSGLYSISLTGSGAAQLSLDGAVAVDDSVAHGPGTWSAARYLTAGHAYGLRLKWLPLDNQDGTKSTMAVGLAYESSAVQAAVAVARRAQVAIVIAADYSGETFDRPSLQLPGDQNALIEAVAAANPHTVVVLDTSGPVLMPWLNRVSAVLEAWYPGEEDGAALAGVLAGDYDPSGHLPVTFPASQTATAVSSPAQWPGTDFVSSYSEGLDLGYRYDNQTGTRPLFPFGFGLSYTTFSFRGLSVSPGPLGVDVSVKMTNTGRRFGRDVIQAYLTYPAAAREPPGQLVAFRSVAVHPGATVTVNWRLARSELRTYQRPGWTVIPGRYTLGVGDSSATLPLHASFRYS
jgi:beta-glucosidase